MTAGNTTTFINKARKVHGEKYNYNKVEYINNKTKVEIICPIHGSFLQRPYNHIQGQGCPLCANNKSSKRQTHTTEEFIEKAREVHHNFYNYSKTKYKDAHTKIEIICPIHGSFFQIPYNHLQGKGCQSCAGVKKYTTEEFIEKAKKVHNNFYDYSKVEYKNNSTKIEIICPIHGSFWQKPNGHLQGYGCSVCAGNKSLTTEKFIEKAKEAHNNFYDYSKVEYKNNNAKVEIICPIHGNFWQKANDHLQGKGCQACAVESNSKNRAYTTEEFIEKAREVHNNFYDYSKVEYKNAHTKVEIVCPIHGKFYQKPYSHLQGKGCQICKASRGEKEVKRILDKNSILYEQQKTFPECKYENLLPFDFYLPELNIAIEYDGRQHYEPVSYFGGEDGFTKTQERDMIKSTYCVNNHIRLIRIKHTVDDIEGYLYDKGIKRSDDRRP